MSTWTILRERLAAVLAQVPEPIRAPQVEQPVATNRAQRRALARQQTQEALRKAARARR